MKIQKINERNENDLASRQQKKMDPNQNRLKKSQKKNQFILASKKVTKVTATIIK